MAGLATAARVERPLPPGHDHRARLLSDPPAAHVGVPQGDHLHVLLPGGANALESLLPGFGEGLRAAGAVPMAAPSDLLWINPAGWVQPFPPHHPPVGQPDAHRMAHSPVRQGDPGISIIADSNVADLRLSPTGGGSHRRRRSRQPGGIERPHRDHRRRSRGGRHRPAIPPPGLARPARLRSRPRLALTRISPTPPASSGGRRGTKGGRPSSSSRNRRPRPAWASCSPSRVIVGS